MKKLTFRKGQKLVCVHYKDKPFVKVEFIIRKSRNISGYTGPEIWVKDLKDRLWWGPTNWFKPFKISKQRKQKLELRLLKTLLNEMVKHPKKYAHVDIEKLFVIPRKGTK